ncbi:hypothetical protein VVD49_12840 [Uliginosibacterium sp. H3]|uniref:Uncharacterized protein n=1 Tax=Uliginosibacterium silvisoli TaxID=3114758 RepID=A0ABU6K5V9_9RHOO|nr:hypothetical protein [Uliginosibacterium sp. H3]
MDSVVAQLVARLNMFLTQELDFQVDMQRFGDEPEYAAQVLGLVDEIGNYEFSTLAAQIRQRQLAIFIPQNVSTPAPTTDDNTPMRRASDNLVPPHLVKR